MSIPIVIVHTGLARHLELAIAQAREASPLNPIVLMGNHENAKMRGIDHHVSLHEYFDSAKQFASLYEHHSPNEPDYELFCFQRWFALRDWMKASNVESAWAMDSDILLYGDLSEIEKSYPEPMSFVQTSGHTTLVREIDALNHYLDRCLDLYSDNSTIASWLDQQVQMGRVPNICDMSIFESLHRNSSEFGNLLEPRNGFAFDDRLSATMYFHGNEIKDIRWREAMPQAHHRETDQWVDMVTLHFQSGLKRRMTQYLPRELHPNVASRIRHQWWSIKRRLVRKLPVDNSFDTVQRAA